MAVKPPPPIATLRSVEMNSSVWFIASDVCAALGIPHSKAKSLSPSMQATVKDDQGSKALAVNAEGLLVLLTSRSRGSHREEGLQLGNRLQDPQGAIVDESAFWARAVGRGAREVLQAVNVAWPAEAAGTAVE